MMPRTGWASAVSQDFENFTALRTFLLNEIGGAKRRVWFVTDFLSDGETVSSLYVAKYRGLDVAVLLGRAKASTYMSRLNYLKRQNIPATLRPADFPLRDPTLLLIDDQLFRIDGEVNFLEQQRAFRVVRAEQLDNEAFQAAFVLARRNPETVVAAPVPLVGKPRHNNTVFSNTSNNETGEYNYDRGPKAAAVPQDAPRQLPRETIYQKRGRPGHDAHAPVEQSKRSPSNTRESVLNPTTAREPIIWSPRSPESF